MQSLARRSGHRRPDGQTPGVNSETVASALPYASRWRRLVAYLLDTAIGYGVATVTGFGVLGLSLGPGRSNGDAWWLGPAVFVVGTSPLLIWWLYSAGLESSERQATLGKLAVRIIVTDLRGARISFPRATVRFVARLLPAAWWFVAFVWVYFGQPDWPWTAHVAGWTLVAIGLVGAAMVLVTPRRQGLQDIVARTLVLARRPERVRPETAA